LLTAVAIDPNDCIFPIAMGLVEVECTSSWEWFLTTLRDDLNITNTAHFTVMSDKQKGLINAVKSVFPDAEHRHCVRHLYQNFHKKHKGETLKNDLWAIARSTNIPTWQRNMDKMKEDNQEAFDWVEELAPNTWIKAFFSDFPKCDMLLNNHSEVFNRYSCLFHSDATCYN
jgi:transposase-like protein